MWLSSEIYTVESLVSSKLRCSASGDIILAKARFCNAELNFFFEVFWRTTWEQGSLKSKDIEEFLQKNFSKKSKKS